MHRKISEISDGNLPRKYRLRRTVYNLDELPDEAEGEGMKSKN